MADNWPEVFVLRHGQTEWNLENRMQGGLDSALTDLGRAQAQRQGQILARCDLAGAQAWCSPQGRAVVTAGLAVAGHVPMIRTDDRLREIGVGDWQGRLRGDIPELASHTADEGGALALYDTAPGGEGLSALRARVTDFLTAHTGARLVIVTHGITSRVLRLVLTGQGLDAIDRIGGGQGVVFHLKGGVQTRLD